MQGNLPPLVSVVIATYNGEKFLRAQLDSLFLQTYSNIEIIALDDGSSDSSMSILNEYAVRHKHMKVFVNEKNLGHVKTFEKGIQLCSGEFISLCDQDDVWDRHKTEITIAAFRKDTLLVYCDSLFVDERGESLGRKISDIKNLTNYTSALPFLIGNTVAGHAAIFRKELVAKALPLPSQVIHDWWLAYVATLYGTIEFVNKSLVKYRQHSNNVIGAIKVKGRKRESEVNRNQQIKERIQLFLEKCPNSNVEVKNVLTTLRISYDSFSFSNNLRRMMVFFSHKDELLATKKRSAFRKWLFCLKMFFKII
jgi:glycosyltransferase involved in cell wall biosynthesis